MTVKLIALAAVFACSLSACGGGNANHTASPEIVAASGPTAASSPQPSAPVAASSPAASQPAAASTPDTTASEPVAASDPASAPTQASQPVASAPASASTPIVKIAVFGDDQMAGIAISQFGMPTLVTPNEPAQLQTLLQSEFNDSGISVQNISSGGTSSSLQNELDGMDGLGNGQPQRMQASGATIVIEEHALNDALGGETVDEYSAYLGQWIQDAKTAGLQPVLEEPGPVCDGNHPQLPAYVAAMDAAASTYNIPIIKTYSLISGIDGWQAHMLGCTVPDSTLDAFRAQQEQAVIGPLVKNLLGG